MATMTLRSIVATSPSSFSVSLRRRTSSAFVSGAGCAAATYTTERNRAKRSMGCVIFKHNMPFAQARTFVQGVAGDLRAWRSAHVRRLARPVLLAADAVQFRFDLLVPAERFFLAPF